MDPTLTDPIRGAVPHHPSGATADLAPAWEDAARCHGTTHRPARSLRWMTPGGDTVQGGVEVDGVDAGRR
jgi:hypothetical protein